MTNHDGPPDFPCTQPAGFLRQPQVLALIPISKSTLWRRVRSGTFPMPLKLSPRVTVWRVEDVRDWIKAQGAPSRQTDARRARRAARGCT